MNCAVMNCQITNTTVTDQFKHVSKQAFSTVDEDLESLACKTSSIEANNLLIQQLITCHAKLNASHHFMKTLTEKVKVLQAFVSRLDHGSSYIAKHPYVMKLSTLTTTHHMLERYQSVLQKDILSIEAAIEIRVNTHSWESWYQFEEQLQNFAPNVYSFLLW